MFQEILNLKCVKFFGLFRIQALIGHLHLFIDFLQNITVFLSLIVPKLGVLLLVCSCCCKTIAVVFILKWMKSYHFIDKMWKPELDARLDGCETRVDTSQVCW